LFGKGFAAANPVTRLKTKKIWLLGAVGKSGKLIEVIGALGTTGRAAPPTWAKS